MQTARIAAAQQPRRSKLPPLIPDSFGIGVFYMLQTQEVPVPLMSKLKQNSQVFTKTGETAEVPAHSRFVRRSASTSPFSINGGVQAGDACFEMASGLPWNYGAFVKRSVELGHPTNFAKLVPRDIQDAIDFHVEHSHTEVSQYRLRWCKQWWLCRVDSWTDAKGMMQSPGTLLRP